MSEAMMKPYVICHMVSSVDGRILPSRWWPKGIDTAGLFERFMSCSAATPGSSGA